MRRSRPTRRAGRTSDGSSAKEAQRCDGVGPHRLRRGGVRAGRLVRPWRPAQRPPVASPAGGAIRLRRCIALDLLAHGDTEIAPDQDVSVTANANDAGEFLDALGIDKVDLVGNDSGGGIAQIFAALNPVARAQSRADRLRRARQLAAGGVQAVPRDGGRRRPARPLDAMLADKNIYRSAEALGPAYEHPERVSDETIETYLRPLVRTEQRTATYSASSPPSTAGTRRGRGGLRTLKAPTLIAWGTDDVYFDVDGRVGWPRRFRARASGSNWRAHGSSSRRNAPRNSIASCAAIGWQPRTQRGNHDRREQEGRRLPCAPCSRTTLRVVQYLGSRNGEGGRGVGCTRDCHGKLVRRGRQRLRGWRGRAARPRHRQSRADRAGDGPAGDRSTSRAATARRRTRSDGRLRAPSKPARSDAISRTVSPRPESCATSPSRPSASARRAGQPMPPVFATSSMRGPMSSSRSRRNGTTRRCSRRRSSAPTPTPTLAPTGCSLPASPTRP